MEHVIRFFGGVGRCGACRFSADEDNTDAIAGHVAKSQPIYREKPFRFEDWPEERYSEDDFYPVHE